VSEGEGTIEAGRNKTGILRILSFLWDILEMGIPLISMIAALALCFTQVVLRYVFHSSIQWSVEIARWFVVWMTFAGSAYAFKVGAHVSVEAVVNILPAKPRRIVEKIASMLTVFFFIAMTYYGSLFLLDSIRKGQVAPASRLPMALAYAAIPIGSVMILTRFYITKKTQQPDEKESTNP
jgi:C4-dicarboxylate transporter DctQ subunit